jgi:hypothetical protein
MVGRGREMGRRWGDGREKGGRRERDGREKGGRREKTYKSMVVHVSSKVC